MNSLIMKEPGKEEEITRTFDLFTFVFVGGAISGLFLFTPILLPLSFSLAVKKKRNAVSGERIGKMNRK